MMLPFPGAGIEGLDKTYHLVDPALSGVSLSVGKGEISATASRKRTFLAIIACSNSANRPSSA